jgi:hypothetical protein
MASCIDLIPNARLYTRSIQLHLLSFWKPVSQKLDVNIPFTQHLKSHLIWWKKWSKHAERPTFSTTKNQYNHNDRCFEIGLRRFYGEPSISGYLVVNGMFPSNFWETGFQKLNRWSWIGLIYRRAFGIKSMHETIIPNRWRKSLAWLY